LKINSIILLYSVNSKIAYFINETFYAKHFVWCSPVFDTEKLESLNLFKKIPPSSNPFTIYTRLKQDVSMCDLHSANISKNKAGLKKGAIHYLGAGIIDGIEFAKINSIIDSAPINEFSPLLYVIPRKGIESRIIQVQVDKSANPLSIEYQIVDLNKTEFEVIEF
jgi:hypothetical protein